MSTVWKHGENVAESREVLDNRFRAAWAFLLGFCTVSWIDEGVSWLTISLQPVQGERVRGRSHATVQWTLLFDRDAFFPVMITLCRPCVIIVNTYRNVGFKRKKGKFTSVIQTFISIIRKELLWLISLGLIGSQLKIKIYIYSPSCHMKAHTYPNGRLLITPGHSHNNNNNKHTLRNIRWHCDLH